MTQDASDPYQINTSNKYKWTYFTNRQNTGLSHESVQSLSNSLIQINVVYNDEWWLQIPIVKWFMTGDEETDNTVYEAFYANTQLYQNDGQKVSDISTYGYLSAELRQGEFKNGIDYFPSTLGTIIATTGARATGLFGLVAIFIGGYQSFSYDQSSLKHFYMEDNFADLGQVGAGDLNQSAHSEIRSRMMQQLNRSGQSFGISYAFYFFFSYLDGWCCCFTKKCTDGKGSFSRKLRQYRRFEVARLKLFDELSIASYIRMKRLTMVTFKTWFKRRQRESIKLFRRYSVKNDEIDPDELNNPKKQFDMYRVVDECNFDVNRLDRRILYEMTGERLTPEDF